MDGYRLQEITENDITELIQIENQSFNSPWSKTDYISELNQEHAFSYAVKLPDKKKQVAIAGYISYRIVANEMHILKLAVSPEFRRKKIATWILTECTADAIKLNTDIAFVETRFSNTNAIKLYKNMGFKEIGIRKNYYQDNGESAIVFEKKLKKEML